MLGTAPLLGSSGDTAQAAPPRCSGEGGGSPSPSPTSSEDPGPLPTIPPLPTGSGSPSPTGTDSPSPTGTASPSGSPSQTQTPQRAPVPAQTTTTPTSSPTASPSESPVNPPPDGTERCESKITISYNGNRQRFTGEVRSGKSVCERGRRVILKRDRKERRDRAVANTVTDREGKYRIPFASDGGGRFYTKTPRRRVTRTGDDIVCQGDRSRTISTRSPL